VSGVPVISSLSSLSITNNTSCGPNSAHFLRPWSLGTQLETSCSSSLGRQGKSGDGELGTNNGHTPHRDKRGILILSSTWLFLARILLMEALFANSRNGSLQLTNLPAVAQAKKPCSRHVFPYQNYNYNNFSPPEHVKSQKVGADQGGQNVSFLQVRNRPRGVAFLILPAAQSHKRAMGSLPCGDHWDICQHIVVKCSAFLHTADI